MNTTVTRVKVTLGQPYRRAPLTHGRQGAWMDCDERAIIVRQELSIGSVV